MLLIIQPFNSIYKYVWVFITIFRLFLVDMQCVCVSVCVRVSMCVHLYIIMLSKITISKVYIV